MEDCLKTMKALADKNRTRIVAALWSFDELCACQITELLQVSGATASRHLDILQKAGLVSSRKDGRWVYYRLLRPDRSGPLFQWLEQSLSGAEELVSDYQTLKRIVGITREDLCRMQRGEACCPR